MEFGLEWGMTALCKGFVSSARRAALVQVLQTPVLLFPGDCGEEAGVYALQPTDCRRTAAVLHCELLLNLTAQVKVYFPLHHNCKEDTERPVQLHC